MCDLKQLNSMTLRTKWRTFHRTFKKGTIPSSLRQGTHLGGQRVPVAFKGMMRQQSAIPNTAIPNPPTSMYLSQFTKHLLKIYNEKLDSYPSLEGMLGTFSNWSVPSGTSSTSGGWCLWEWTLKSSGWSSETDGDAGSVYRSTPWHTFEETTMDKDRVSQLFLITLHVLGFCQSLKMLFMSKHRIMYVIAMKLQQILIKTLFAAQLWLLQVLL